MPHYVLVKRRGGGQVTAEPNLAEVSVLDRTGERAILIDATPEQVERLQRDLKGWSVSEEKIHPQPGPVQYQPKQG